MRKNYKNYNKTARIASSFNIVADTYNNVDAIVRENSDSNAYERYLKRVKTYDELVSYVTSNVASLEFYYNVTFKKMSNDSLSVKTLNNKRICRIDSAYDKIRITTDRVNVLRNVHDSFEERIDPSMHHYAVIKFSVDEFSEVFQKIINNAKAMNLLTA